MDLQSTSSFSAYTTFSLSLHSPKHSTTSPIPNQPFPTHDPSIIRFHRIHHNADIRSAYCVVISGSRTHWNHTWAGRGRPEEGNKSSKRSRAESVWLAPFHNISLFNLDLIDGLSCLLYRGHPVHHLHKSLPPHLSYICSRSPGICGI